tara:strand:+ start:11607 stop:11897 length:291 start_codon:yes stop_codon:yes gene_type:complete
MAEENKTLNLVVDNEQREYPLDILSQDALNKIAAMQFDANTVMPILSEMIRLAQLGQKVDQGELSNMLPKSGYTIAEQPEAAVEAGSEEPEEESSE